MLVTEMMGKERKSAEVRSGPKTRTELRPLLYLNLRTWPTRGPVLGIRVRLGPTRSPWDGSRLREGVAGA